MAQNWIQGAIKKPGSFTKQAKGAGMSVGKYAQKELHASGTLGKRARLAKTLAKLKGKKM